jgi:hypothetical protein
VFGLIFGIILILFGLCLIADVGKVATGLFTFFDDFMDPGRATVGTFRLVGMFAVLLGAGWVATSFPLR